MKTLTFKRDSWHFWIATRLGRFTYYRRGPNSTDFCEYIRAVLLCCLLGFVFLLVACFLLFCLSDTFVWLYNCYRVGHFFDPGKSGAAFILMILGVVVFLGICAGIAYSILWLAVKSVDRQSTNTGAPPSFISKAYESFKDRVCFRVELE